MLGTAHILPQRLGVQADPGPPLSRGREGSCHWIVPGESAMLSSGQLPLKKEECVLQKLIRRWGKDSEVKNEMHRYKKTYTFIGVRIP